MKILTTILIFVIIIFLTFSIMTKKSLSDDNFDQENIASETPGFDKTTANYMGTEEEEDPMYSDPDIFLRKLEQKKLPPLTGKEKIVWSFRLAQTHQFL
ncbi:MAG: hypothetical protein KAW12_15270 [Candidatus Aminicenantes bacterium]|nr:hypothetical protein [Candidatus Aminicenantes bacterium]